MVGALTAMPARPDAGLRAAAGYALPPSAYPRRHSHPDCRCLLTLNCRAAGNHESSRAHDNGGIGKLGETDSVAGSVCDPRKGSHPDSVFSGNALAFNPLNGGRSRRSGGAIGELEMTSDPKRKPHQDEGDSDRRRRREEEEALDEALKNTFPASDPVSIEQPTTTGRARRS